MNGYANFRGEAVSLDPELHAKPKVKRERGEGYHNGWRVQGIPPGALQEARDENARLAALNEKAGGKPLPPFNDENWLMNAKRKPVRGKPFAIPQAAQECKALAAKAGWLRVEVVELKKEKAVA
jgi:hypothetical protein